MCHFISWIDLDGQLYYLTSKELRSKRGKELKEYLDSAYAETADNGSMLGLPLRGWEHQ